MTTLSIDIPKEKITNFCRGRHIRRLSLFGSVLRNDFSADSDVDVLVEFELGTLPAWPFFLCNETSASFLGGRWT